MIVERKFGFAELLEYCCREKSLEEVILQHSRTPPSTSNGNTQVKTSIMVKNTNPNLQEVSKSRVLDTVSRVFPWLQGAAAPAQGMMKEQNFSACVMSDQTTRGTWDEAIKRQGSPQMLWLKAAVPQLCCVCVPETLCTGLFVHLVLLWLIKNMSFTQIKQTLPAPRNCLQS